MTALQKFSRLWRKCRSVRAGIIFVLVRHALYKARGKNILSSNKVTIYGLENITTTGLLKIGLDYVGFMDHHDRTLLRIIGKINFSDDFSIGKGCRIVIGQDAIVNLASGYMNPNTLLIIMHGMDIGSDCAISWGCQFLDEDFHEISYPGKLTHGDNRIIIGSHVWIGSNVSVLKGSVIPDGCVVAAGSVVKSQFDVKNALIGGNPAKVIRQNISWR